MNSIIYYTFIGVLLAFLQVFVFNNILFFESINPFIYIAFVFLFPVRELRFYFLTMAFSLGLFIDVFSDSGGIHAFSTLTIAYIRLFFINLYFRKTPVDYPFFSLQKEPFGKIFNFTVTLTVIHHFILFSLDNFSFQNFSNVLLNTLYSSIFTLLLFFIGGSIFIKKQ
jgi:rod shape-determining protein MreD